MGQQRGGAIVPGRPVHTGEVFAVLAVTGVVALLAGIWGAVSGPGPNDVPGWAGIGIAYGVVASVAGCIGAPLVVGIARRDRAALALVRAHRPLSLAIPGAVSNHALLRSIRALNPSAATPRSVVWAVDEQGMEMWQPETSVPVLAVPWAHVVSTTAESMPQGRAVIAVAVLRLTGGRELRLAFRTRFGGISLMGRDRVDDVLQDFAEIAQPTDRVAR
ncbi:hypothetical protein [Curtobacterium sp. MCBD17_003]|uniref:hypothetical protein n=1 Tax=Curtobacterium sp. MCBD17_003 TaxID=2175667 RepID=UPI0011B4B358|nr:hypothetical protein [Curtobacterium sp. MCBD17_003]WIE54771.1 hypothetical protein DEI88_000790 [Curtobacterium sp. MCBD17_003]